MSRRQLITQCYERGEGAYVSLEECMKCYYYRGLQDPGYVMCGEPLQKEKIKGGK